jgi:hypothetical protein
MRHLRSAAVLLLLAALACCSRRESVGSIAAPAVKARATDADPAARKPRIYKKHVMLVRHIPHVEYVKVHVHETRHKHEHRTITIP